MPSCPPPLLIITHRFQDQHEEVESLTDEEVAFVFDVSTHHVCKWKMQISPPGATKTPARVRAICSPSAKIRADLCRCIADMAREYGVSGTVNKRVIMEDLGLSSTDEKQGEDIKTNEVGRGQVPVEVQETGEHSERGKRPVYIC